MSSPIELLHDRVLVKRDKTPDKIGLLWIPDSARKPENTGSVVAMGPGLRKKKLGVRFPMPDIPVGGKVAFREGAGYDLTIDDVEYVILRDEDIAGEIL